MKLALPRLAQQRVTPTSGVGLEAVVTRARFDAMQEKALRYFAPVADTPGFPRAAARTLDELQMAEVPAHLLAEMDEAGADLATLLQRLQRETGKAGTVSRAGLWQAATARLTDDASPGTGRRRGAPRRGDRVARRRAVRGRADRPIRHRDDDRPGGGSAHSGSRDASGIPGHGRRRRAGTRARSATAPRPQERGVTPSARADAAAAASLLDRQPARGRGRRNGVACSRRQARDAKPSRWHGG